MRQYQNERLKEIVGYAYENVPFCHRKFGEAGIRPSDIRTVEDLKKLPLTSKDEIRNNSDSVLSKKYDVSELQIHRTSGSTGQPLHFYVSAVEDEYRKARHLRANAVCGQKLRDRYVTITHPLYFSQTTRLQRLLGLYAPMPVSVFDDVERQVLTIEKLKPDIIDGYASSLLLLAKRVEEKGVKTFRPRFLISGADLIDKHSRRYVERVFNVPFYDQYACAELERIAWQCEERAEYHIDADSIILECVDADGEKVAPGETGEIVCTSLFNHAMPFIRYRVGDVGQVSEEDNCPCGRTFPLIKIMEGRKDAVILLPDGRAMSSFAIIAAMYQLRFYSEIEQFRVVQKKDSLFSFLIKLKEDRVNQESAERELVELFRRILDVKGDELSFEVNFVDSIPLDESGKFRIVISLPGQSLKASG